MEEISTRVRGWQIWERPATPRSFQLQPRDIKIIAAVFRHRFLQPAHVHALFPDGSPANLNRRLALLWQNGYLERPKAQRPTRILTEEIVYGLANEGARLLEQLDPRLKIGRLDWNDRPGKPVGWPYLDHQLHVATFFVALERACRARRVGIEWPGHYERMKFRIPVPGTSKKFLPDGYFRLVRADGRVAHHFLEMMRTRRTLQVMHEKLHNYFLWWRDGSGRDFKHFRVLTVTPNPAFMDSLRNAARPIGRSREFKQTWKALMFTHLEAFDLKEPERILEPVFRYADGDARVALV